MIKFDALSNKNKDRYHKLVESHIVNGDDEASAISKAVEALKDEGVMNEKKYVTFSDFMVEEEPIDINKDGVIDNEDVKLALDELEITTTLEDDLIELLTVSAEHDLIPSDMLDGIFELVGDHIDLSEFEEPDDELNENIEGVECSIEEVRAKALIRKKGGKRRVRCTSGPNKGRIRVAGQCGKKVNLRLSRKLKRSKKRISKAKKSLSAKRGQRTSKRRGTS